MIELERASARLFTAADTPARALQTALGQVRDWDEWIKRNEQTFVRDVIDHCKTLPRFPQRAANGSFLLADGDSLEQAWRAFGGFSHPKIRFTVVLGRWSQLSEIHKNRLVYMNRHDSTIQEIYTYDQLVRRSHSRPAINKY